VAVFDFSDRVQAKGKDSFVVEQAGGGSELTAVCVEEGKVDGRSRTYAVGTAAGELIQYKVGSKKRPVRLFDGASSPVSCLAWCGAVLAWADSRHVRLLSVPNQTALCFINAPTGIPMDSASSCFTPCSLYWEAQSRLLVGWGDTFRQVDLSGGYLDQLAGFTGGKGKGKGTVSSGMRSGSNAASDTSETLDISARVSAEWQLGCVICGAVTLDADHVVLLGFSPPSDQIIHEYLSLTLTDAPEEAYVMPYKALQPDLYVVRRDSGAVVSADALPLPGCTVDSFRSPADFLLLTSYAARSGRENYSGWHLTTSNEKRGGTKGLAPTMFVMAACPPAPGASKAAAVGATTGAVTSSSGVVSVKSLQRNAAGTGVVVVRARDTHDRVAAALKAQDLRSAVYYALADRAAIRPAGNFDVLVSMYLEDLLDCGRFDVAAGECKEIIGLDALLWERWISVFHRFNALPALVRQLPVRQVKLSEESLEAVLYNLLTGDTRAFLETVQAWGPVEPPLFDKLVVISRLEAIRTQPQQASNVWQKIGVLEGRTLDSFVLEAMAVLHASVEEYEQALECLLDIDAAEAEEGLQFGAADAEGADSAPVLARDFHLVYELIERRNLFHRVEEKLFNVIRLNKALAGRLLVKHIDKFPVSSVLRQLSSSGSNGRRWQLWYLHTLFLSIPDTYNTSEFAEYHVLQVGLYCEFAPPPPISLQRLVDADLLARRAGGEGAGKAVRPAIVETKANIYTSDLMIFLKVSSFVPLELALRECQQVVPTPLYPEIIYIYSRLGNKKQALELLLTKIGDVKLIIEFVESHDRALWADVIDYAAREPVFLGSLLDHIGKCSSINPSVLLQRIQPDTQIPFLRERLEEVVSAHMFQAFLTEKCGDVLFSDTVSLLRKLNHGQRRAIKIDQLGARCCLCGKALAQVPDYDSCTIIASNELVQQLQKSGAVGSGGKGGLHDNPVSVSSMNVLWRSGCAQNFAEHSGVAIFHNKGNSFHRVCYRKLMSAADEQQNSDPNE